MKRISIIVLTVLAVIGVIAFTVGSGINNPETPIASGFYPLKFFVTQSNLILIIYALFGLSPKIKDSKKYDSWFGAVVVYLMFSTIVYVTLLQGVWVNTGLELVGVIITHYVVPISALIMLVVFRKDFHFLFKDVLFWYIYPNLFIGFLLISGYVLDDFIYPFFNIIENGSWSFFLYYFILFVIHTTLSVGFMYLTKRNED